MMMPAQPMPAFVMIQPQLLLEFAVIQFDSPACPGDLDQPSQSHRLIAESRQPVICGRCGSGRPFDEEPLGGTLRMLRTVPTMGCPNFNPGKPGTHRSFGSLPPSYILPV